MDNPVQDQTPQRNIDEILEAIREKRGIAITLIGLLIGIIGNFLFYHQLAGVNIGVYTLMVVVCGYGLAVMFEIPLVWKHSIFGLVAIYFTLMLGVLSAPLLVMMNLAMALLATGIFFRFGRVTRFLGGSIAEFVNSSLETLLAGWLEGPLHVLANSTGFIKHIKGRAGSMQQAAAVARGLLLALPILIIFGLLLGTADVVLGDFLEAFVGWFTPDIEFVNQLVIILLLTWLNAALLRPLILGPAMLDYSLAPGTSQSHKPLFTIGMIESGIVLVSVNLLFLVFVILQARYLFGGESNITAQGYTYSEYARRGFNEMLMASLLTLLLIGALSVVTVRRPEQEKLFYILTGILVLLTGVILGAAWRRLSLYEDTFGYSRLRIGSKVFMVWLGVLLLIMLADVVLKRKLWFATIGSLLCMFGYVATLDAINMDRYIAVHNIERFHETGKIDMAYILVLSDDAIPMMVTLLDDPKLTAAERYDLRVDLADRLIDMDREHARRHGVDFHWSKHQAWKALDQYRALLTNLDDENPDPNALE